MSTFLSTNLPEAWLEFFEAEKAKSYWQPLESFVEQAFSKKQCYPAPEQIFEAFRQCAPENVKCIILGQDPYHGPGQAMGLSFSVPRGQKVPPSLRNIFKEYADDLGYEVPDHGDLSLWAAQGILLLNSVLTVEEKKAGSHAKKGWEIFVENALEFVLERNEEAGFICFGKPARRVADRIIEKRASNDCILVETPHPSPLSAYRGFFGSRPFTKFNDLREKKGLEPLSWELGASDQTKLF